MDLHLSDDLLESYQRFQSALRRGYEKLVTTDHLVPIDAAKPVEQVLARVRGEVKPLLAGFPKVETLVHG